MSVIFAMATTGRRPRSAACKSASWRTRVFAPGLNPARAASARPIQLSSAH